MTITHNREIPGKMNPPLMQDGSKVNLVRKKVLSHASESNGKHFK